MTYNTETVWIIGASSGIGAALARELSAQGATLILSARRKDDLDRLAGELVSPSEVVPLDVADAEAVAQACASFAGRRIDRVVFLAAVYQPDSLENMELKSAYAQVDVNLKGALNVIHATLPMFKSQGMGQLALCGSVAGYIGLPNGQPYSATKAAVNNLAETLYAEAPAYLDVKLIAPGFVRTPMTDKNDFDMPFRIEPEDAARAIANGLRKKRFEIHFPKRFTLIIKTLQTLPYWLSLRLTRGMTR